MSDDDIERLSAAYRATVEDPPHDAADAVLLRAASKRARTLPLPRLLYAVAAGLLVALGVAVELQVVTSRPLPSHVDTRTTADRGHVGARPLIRNRQTTASDNYLSHATLSSVSPQRILQPPDPQVLLKTAAFALIPTEPGCAAAASVDLNAPGALAGLKVGRPGDYAKIIGIIAGVTRHPELDVARWITTRFHAEDVSYFPLWLTSLPPRRRLSFCLQGTRYDVVLMITRDGARVSPVDYSGIPRAPARPAPQGAHRVHGTALP